jgi:hypothetical protein
MYSFSPVPSPPSSASPTDYLLLISNKNHSSIPSFQNARNLLHPLLLQDFCSKQRDAHQVVDREWGTSGKISRSGEVTQRLFQWWQNLPGYLVFVDESMSANAHLDRTSTNDIICQGRKKRREVGLSNACRQDYRTTNRIP